MIKILVREKKSTAIIGIGTIVCGIIVGAALLFFRKADSSLRQILLACLAVICMILSGICFCMVYKNRRLQIEDMQLYYSNWLGKKKQFLLDDIGYCRQRENIVLYDSVISLYDLSSHFTGFLLPSKRNSPLCLVKCV